MVKAIIMGVDGQDGSYLADLLLSKGYDVVGWVPDLDQVSYGNIQHNLSEMTIVKGDYINQESFVDLLDFHKPDELYNLASPSFPSLSWENIIPKSNVIGLGAGRLLEAIRLVSPKTKYYQASTSEMFGEPEDVPQTENTPFHPRNPYGVAKLFAHWLTKNYRSKYDLFAVSGILFNHESPRRGYQYVTRKITRSVAEIKLGLKNELFLGNLDARRDWGFAKDYVMAMWMMLQDEHPDDYVVGTGETHSVREFCEIAFNFVDMDYMKYVKVSDDFYRPVESKQLVANNQKIKDKLMWSPSVNFQELVELMVEHDLNLLKAEKSKS